MPLSTGRTVGRNFPNKYSKWSVPSPAVWLYITPLPDITVTTSPLPPIWPCVQSRLIYVPTNIWWSWYYRCHPDVLIPGHCPPCPLWSRHQSMIISSPPPHWDSLIQTQSATAGILGLTNRGQYKCLSQRSNTAMRKIHSIQNFYSFSPVCMKMQIIQLS